MKSFQKMLKEAGENSLGERKMETWSAWCKHYRKDTDQCITGCKKEKIKKGNLCPFGGSDQEECACYEKR